MWYETPGAIESNIIGSVYERSNTKGNEFPLFSKGCRFTDDTVLIMAIADAIVDDFDYALKLKEYERS